MRRLDGKVAIITGSNSGVGAATAKLFAKEGAKVVISARRLPQLEEVAEDIRANGGEVLIVQTDVSKVEDAENLVAKTVEAFGKVDVLVNNAGVLEAGYDIRHGLIGAGVYASHGYERSHKDGVENTLKLLVAYCK